jgi:ATP-binding cassette, subfamily G (WHITE), member 2, PDR
MEVRKKSNMLFNSPYIARNLGIILAIMVFHCALYLLATEYISLQKPRGEVLLFRRRKLPQVRMKEDEETKGGLENKLDLHEEPSVSTKITAIEMAHAANFVWNELSYDIKVNKGQKRILDNVEGWVKPGTLTALMVGAQSLEDLQQLTLV